MLGHSTPYHPASTPGMSGQYPGAYGGPMGQQQSLHQMQSENQRMMNELQRIRQMGGGAMPGATVPAAGMPMGGVGGYPMPAYAHGGQGQPMMQHGAGQNSHIALQQMEAQLQAQLQWLKQQQHVGAYA